MIDMSDEALLARLHRLFANSKHECCLVRLCVPTTMMPCSHYDSHILSCFTCDRQHAGVIERTHSIVKV